MPAHEDYKVRLEVFEGPLDLLLYLIRKDELDIYDIPIERITTQYMQYLDLMRMLDLNIAGEFLVMAATLMMIKSRLLLPPEERAALEDEEEDPRWDLVRQLVEYKKFKDAAQHLGEIERRRLDVYARPGAVVVGEASPDVSLHDVSLFDLITAFNEALRRVPPEGLHEIFAEHCTVPEKMEVIVHLLRAQDQVSFSSLFRSVATRYEIVCTFLALLELIRQKQVRAVQEGSFEEIMIQRMGDELMSEGGMEWTNETTRQS